MLVWPLSEIVERSVAKIFSSLPGVNLIRTMRIFRVFRIFRRIESLRKIMSALAMSVPNVRNALAILCLVTAIYTIIFVQFYKDIEPDLFGSFFPAFFALYQALTGDGWSEQCRDLMEESGQGQLVAVIYVSFMLIVSLVLLNVVMAVLLQNFTISSEVDPWFEFKEEVEDEILRDPFERMSKLLSIQDDNLALARQLDSYWVRIVERGNQNRFQDTEVSL
jgi:voltage-gated sodium channel